jgi:hypothetical protein
VLGLDPDAAAEWAGLHEPAPPGCVVWPENWPIVEVFLAMDSQWRWTGGMQSFRAGLDFAALAVVYEGLQVPRKRRPEVFQGLKVMERAVLDALDKS